MPELRGGSKWKQGVEVVVMAIARPVRGQQKHFRTTLGYRKVASATGRADEQTIDEVQLGEIARTPGW
jgi:hypothetical protein